MRPERVRAARDQPEIRDALRVVLLEDVVADRFQLVFVVPRPRRAHRFHDRHAGDARRLANQRDLARTLDQAHRVEHRIEILHRHARRLRLHAPDERRLARQPPVPRIFGRLLGMTHDRVRRRRAQRFRRGAADTASCPARPNAVSASANASRSSTRSMPVSLIASSPGDEHRSFRSLVPLVARRQIHGRLLRLAVDHQDRARHFDAGEIEELIVLPEFDVGGIFRRALQHGGAVADRLHHAGAARRELLGRKRVGEQRLRLAGPAAAVRPDRDRERQRDSCGARHCSHGSRAFRVSRSVNRCPIGTIRAP